MWLSLDLALRCVVDAVCEWFSYDSGFSDRFSNLLIFVGFIFGLCWSPNLLRFAGFLFIWLTSTTLVLTIYRWSSSWYLSA
jgi:hypothetical protein